MWPPGGLACQKLAVAALKMQATAAVVAGWGCGQHCGGLAFQKSKVAALINEM
jgi:hypothetical protein